MRNTVPFKRLADVAPAIPAKRTPLPEDKVWHLSLDQVEANSRRIINPVYAPFAQAGSSTHLFDEGNVLYSKLRPYLNKVVCPNQPGVATTELVPLRPDPSRLDRHYLCYYLRSPEFVNWISSQVAGAKMPRVSMKVFWNHEIPLPPLEEQKRIAAILDKADTVRRKRAEAIKLADEFLKSAFLDLFGDPVTNPKGWEVQKVGDITQKVQIGPFGSQLHQSDYITGGIPLVNPKHMLDNHIVPEESFTVPTDIFDELPNYHLRTGDVLMARRGEIGRCAMVTEKEDGWFCGTGSLFLRPSNKLNSIYALWVITSESMKTKLDDASLGITMKNLNRGIVEKLPIPVPPIKAQEQFSDIVGKQWKINTKYRRACEEIDSLFNSLAQRAFRGEL